MKSIIQLLICLMGSLSSATPFVFDGQIAVLDTGPNNPHHRKVSQVLQKNLGQCKPCKVKNFAIYEKNGDLTSEKMLRTLSQVEKLNIRLIHLSWNLPRSPQTESIEHKIASMAERGFIFVAATGADQQGGFTNRELKTTVMGNSKRTFLIGELNSQGQLSLDSHFGPEMLTALAPPSGLKGSSYSAPLFTAALATWWRMRHQNTNPDQVFQSIMQKKADRYLPRLDQLF